MRNALGLEATVAETHFVGVAHPHIGDAQSRFAHLGGHLAQEHGPHLPFHRVGGQPDPGRLNTIHLDHQVGVAFLDVVVHFLDAPTLAILLQFFAHLLGQAAQLRILRAEQLHFHRAVGARHVV